MITLFRFSGTCIFFLAKDFYQVNSLINANIDFGKLRLNPDPYSIRYNLVEGRLYLLYY